MAGAIASAMLFAFPAFAQDSRLSLADRVARLEQQTQNRDQSGTGMVNQMQQLQAQVQQLQGQIEELQHQMQELQDKGKAQYTDLDARLQRLEGGGAGAAAAGGQSSAQAVPASAPPTAAAPGGDMAPSAAGSSGNSGATADPAAAQAAYDTAFKAIRSGDYANASRQFRSFIQQYPNHALVPNAWYWLGESYYVTTNYQVALEAFQHLVNQFPQSDKTSEGLLKVGYCQYELKQLDAAKATLQQVTRKYPGSKVATLAQERLQRMQLQAAN